MLKKKEKNKQKNINITLLILLPISETAGVEFAELVSGKSISFLFLPSWNPFSGGKMGKFSPKFPGKSGSWEGGIKLWKFRFELSRTRWFIPVNWFISSKLGSTSEKGKEGLKLWKSVVNSAMRFEITELVRGSNGRRRWILWVCVRVLLILQNWSCISWKGEAMWGGQVGAQASALVFPWLGPIYSTIEICPIINMGPCFVRKALVFLFLSYLISILF